MPELDGKKRIIDYETVINPDENYYVPVDNGTEGTGKVSVKMVGPSNMISDAYDATSTYKVGDLCIYNNKLYVCTVDINTPHAFDLSEWELDTLGNYVSEINSSLSNLVKSTTVTGTTTSSGALAIPNELKSKPLIDLHYDSANGLVFRRDNDYLTCLALSLQPFSNTSVSITVWYLDV